MSVQGVPLPSGSCRNEAVRDLRRLFIETPLEAQVLPEKLAFQSIGVQDFSEFGLDPFRREAEFRKRVVMTALEFALLFRGAIKLLANAVRQGPAKMRVNFVDSFRWVPDQIAIIDAVVIL